MDFYQYIVEVSTVLATFLLLLSAETVTETTNQAESSAHSHYWRLTVFTAIKLPNNKNGH